MKNSRVMARLRTIKKRVREAIQVIFWSGEVVCVQKENGKTAVLLIAQSALSDARAWTRGKAAN